MNKIRKMKGEVDERRWLVVVVAMAVAVSSRIDQMYIHMCMRD